MEKATTLRLPLFMLIAGIFGLSMLVPAIYALSLEMFHMSRSFLYSAVLTVSALALIGIAIRGRERRATSLDHLLALFCIFTFLPVILAVPFYEAMQTTSFMNAYFEMVSSITTTGATLFDPPDRLAMLLHL